MQEAPPTVRVETFSSIAFLAAAAAPARYFRTELSNGVSSSTGIRYSAGQVSGLIGDIPAVAETIDAMMKMSALIGTKVVESLSEIA